MSDLHSLKGTVMIIDNFKWSATWNYVDSPFNEYKLEHMPGNDIMSPGQPHRSQPEGSLVVTLKTKIILDFTELKFFVKMWMLDNSKIDQIS